MNNNNILVLGVGNILLKDDGIGVHIVRDLEKTHCFSDNISILDGGTLGMKLLNEIIDYNYLIVVDALKSGKKPGTISVYSYKDFKSGILIKNSIHQVSFLEILTYAEMLDSLPAYIKIIGIEPQDITPYGTELTSVVANNFEQMKNILLDEINKLSQFSEK